MPSEIKWNGDLNDDCTAKLGNLMAHCECLGDIICVDNSDGSELDAWRAESWFVGVMNKKTKQYLFHSGEHGGMITGGEVARAIAEAIMLAAKGASDAK